MSVKYSGKQEKVRNTNIKEIGPCCGILEVGDDQSMDFNEADDGPFYLANIIVKS